MPDNIIHLPRPHDARGPSTSLGFYVRIGRNDHRDMLSLLAEGERRFFGLVIDAPHVQRHRDLIAEALRQGFDVTLDPKTHAMATIGGHTPAMAALPWGLERPHKVDDFDGVEGRTRARQIVEFALENRFTQILGPTHLLQSANDLWLRRDTGMMRNMREALGDQSSKIQLIYPLALPMQVMRDTGQRRAILAAVTDAPFDAVWLRVENFGSDATGDKMVAYVEACRDLHAFGVPTIADHVGGLPGLGLMAFGAVGGIAHGLTLLETFKADRWRRPPTGDGRTPGVRVYIPQLDLLLNRDDAASLLNSAPRIRSRFGCRDTHCCVHGMRDMLGRPMRHYIHQRSLEIEGLSVVPQSLRPSHYLNERVRRVSDEVVAAASFGAVNKELRQRLSAKQLDVRRFRDAMAHLAEAVPIESVATPPLRRATRERR